MIHHKDIENKALHTFIKNGAITLGGNRRLKIFGSLRCTQGKRMHRENRVFFSNEVEAIVSSYRPCGHCMKLSYQLWKMPTKN